ncbi:MAG: hypothetical protein F6K58_03220 [Symploca sp. SIO2E9]|nr:hypothetical protein [Symploca sp. SIO2E9]
MLIISVLSKYGQKYLLTGIEGLDRSLNRDNSSGQIFFELRYGRNAS